MTLKKFAACITAVLLLTIGYIERNGLHDLEKPGRTTHANREHRSGSLPSADALALYSAPQRQRSFDACREAFPNKRPVELTLVPANLRPLALCSDRFAVLYSRTSKTPLVVVERLTQATLQEAAGEERSNRFYPDPRLSAGERAELSDYRDQHPSWDRGHQAPAADAPDTNAMAQSFSLSNMVPQDPTNNRKIWSKIEGDVRKFARRSNGNVFVFTGPLFDRGYAMIGANKVWVPTRLFKLVYDESSRRAWAYVLPNATTRIEQPVDYAAFVDATGLRLLGDLPVSGSIRE